MSPTKTVSTVVPTTIKLPEHLHEHYSQSSLESGVPLEDLLVERLIIAADHEGRTLCFSGRDRQEFEKILGGRVLKSPHEALKRLKSTQSVKIRWEEDNESKTDTILIPNNILKRVRSRHSRLSLRDALRREIIRGLERFCMLR